MDRAYLTAKEAAAELNIALPTLYAYVSRGLIRSEARSGSRSRLYRAEDVRNLAQRLTPSASDAGGDGRALPVLDSSITLLRDDGVFYRGRPVDRLAQEATLETVANLIWETGDADPFAEPEPSSGLFDALRSATVNLRPLERCQAVLPVVATTDIERYNRTPTGLVRLAARILRWVAATIADSPPSTAPVHTVLATAWAAQGPVDRLIRAALVACADHELNVSTFTVRCVASAGGDPFLAVAAGLAAIQTPRHGRMSERVGAVLPDLLAAGDHAAAVVDRLSRGDDIPGFGHPLYPQGDPRARLLLKLTAQLMPHHPDMRRAMELAEAVQALAGSPPTIDYALEVLRLVGGLPKDAGLSLFTTGRTVGWLAHAMEQYTQPGLIRPRARYVGQHPP